MREIKFRGRNENGWHYGLLTFMFNDYAISHVEDENTVDLIDKATIGQYTGLKDKNGIEIYEGDILLFDDFGMTQNNRVVDFEDGAFYGVSIRNQFAKLLSGFNAYCEVIGNIYENPELLETKKSS